jgi:hypothetical protein
MQDHAMKDNNSMDDDEKNTPIARFFYRFKLCACELNPSN